MKILITGSEGLIRKILRSSLEKDDHELVLIDKNSQNPVDLLKDNLNPYFKEIKTVIHLAANGFWIDEKTAEENVAMTWNVLENCRKENVERIVYTSSINVYDYSRLYSEGKRIDSSTPIKPHAKNDWKERKESVFNYSTSKVLCEQLIKFYSDEYGISGINLRLGAVHPYNHPYLNEPDDNAIWLSHEDLIEIIRKTITFEGLANLVCVSNNYEKFIDLNPIREVLGYKPKSDSIAFSKK